MNPRTDDTSFLGKYKIQTIVGIPVLGLVLYLLFSAVSSQGVMSVAGPKLITLVVAAYVIYFWLSSFFAKFAAKRNLSAGIYLAHILSLLVVVGGLVLILSVRVSVM